MITSGFITLFIALIIPGFIFKRFYYYGEFSKQFTRHDPILKSLIESIIPGLLIHLFCAVLFIFLLEFYSFKELVDSYALMSKLSDLSEVDWSSDLINTLLAYSLLLYFNASFLGFLLSRTVRILKLDTQWKILRFKNEWYYLFHRDILKFKKFKAHISDEKRNQKFLMPYVDVLIEKSENSTALYSGLLVDYDLNPKEIHKLDKLYLTEAVRYKLKDGQQAEKKAIPGDLFVLNANRLININVSWIYRQDIQQNSVDDKQRKLTSYQNLSIVLFVAISILIFYRIEFIEWNWYEHYFSSDVSIWKRIASWLIFNFFYTIWVPIRTVRNNEGGKKLEIVSIKEFLQRLKVFCFLFLILSFLLYFEEIYMWVLLKVIC